ncbi:MAG: hypothetical protein HWN68_13165 [Desulfobacterales bacterium]|nr:hypothetical protein [Desulfobacterales bacterium]
MNDYQFSQLLNHFGLSWDGYRKVRKGVKKRIRRHMHQMGCKTMQEYLAALDQDKEAGSHCELLMTVSVSRFFRDRGLWEILESEILPAIILKNKEAVKCWLAGCACGQEVYSLKIVWDRLGGRNKRLPALEIWATDMNPDYLDKARTGVYHRSSLREAPQALRDIYFESHAKGQFFAVRDTVKKGIFWQVHNLLSDPPATDFQLVFLRNSLLTYYQDELKAPAFEKVVESLDQDGFLIIGAGEKLPSGSRGLLPFAGHPCIFQKEA